MAAITRNATAPVVFEAGGTIVINDGTDDITLTTVEPGTVNIREGGYELREFTIGMDQQTPLLGVGKFSEIDLSAKVADMSEAKNWGTLGRAIDSAAGKAKEYATVTIKFPAYRGATTGKQVVFNNVHFVMPPEIVGGERFDLYRIQLRSRDKYGTWSTY